MTITWYKKTILYKFNLGMKLITSKKLRLSIIIALLIILVIYLGIGLFHHTPTSPPAKDPIKVEVKTLQLITLPQTAISYGSTYAPSAVTLQAQTTGLISAILFKPGQKVEKGSPLFLLQTSNSNLQLNSLKAQLALDKAHYDRALQLRKIDKDSLSDIDFITVKSTYQKTLALYEQAQGINHLNAPISGIVSDTNFAVGDVVNTGDTLAKVINQNDLTIRYQLPSKYNNELHLGELVYFTPTSGKQSYEAHLSYIAPEINPQNAGIDLIATFDTPTQLMPNQFGLIKQVINPNHQSMAIAQNLAQSDTQGFFVYLFKDHKVLKRYFEPGEVTPSGLIVAKSGLQPGDQLIISNPTLLSPGQQVQSTSS